MTQSYETYLKNLLEPLGVYDFTPGTPGECALFALGAALDNLAAVLEHAERESLCPTAEDEGLSRREALFARVPAAPDTARRRAAIAALCRIDGNGLTLDTLNAAIDGCGIRAKAVELGGGRLRVLFPNTAGIPADINRIERIILDILPCHLETEFYFRFLTWAECAAQNFTWQAVEAAGHTWNSFQAAVPPGSK